MKSEVKGPFATIAIIAIVALAAFILFKFTSGPGNLPTPDASKAPPIPDHVKQSMTPEQLKALESGK